MSKALITQKVWTRVKLHGGGEAVLIRRWVAARAAHGNLWGQGKRVGRWGGGAHGRRGVRARGSQAQLVPLLLTWGAPCPALLPPRCIVPSLLSAFPPPMLHHGPRRRRGWPPPTHRATPPPTASSRPLVPVVISRPWACRARGARGVVLPAARAVHRPILLWGVRLIPRGWVHECPRAPRRAGRGGLFCLVWRLLPCVPSSISLGGLPIPATIPPHGPLIAVSACGWPPPPPIWSARPVVIPPAHAHTRWSVHHPVFSRVMRFPSFRFAPLESTLVWRVVYRRGGWGRRAPAGTRLRAARGVWLLLGGHTGSRARGGEPMAVGARGADGVPWAPWAPRMCQQAMRAGARVQDICPPRPAPHCAHIPHQCLHGILVCGFCRRLDGVGV